jgi:DHA2 family methylenomycin A resistance protein-like MFS transporter
LGGAGEGEEMGALGIVELEGPRLPVALGGAVATVGSLVLLGMDETSPYFVMGAGLALSGLGGAFIIPAFTATVMGAAPRRLAGVASAGLNAGRQVGGAIGVALLGTIAASASPSPACSWPSSWLPCPW